MTQRKTAPDLAEVQERLENALQEAVCSRDSALASKDRHSPKARITRTAHHQKFVNDLAAALGRRIENMRECLVQARQRRNDGDAASWHNCLQQAQAQYNWYSWILKTQGKAPEKICASCGLKNPGPHEGDCSSCQNLLPVPAARSVPGRVRA